MTSEFQLSELLKVADRLSFGPHQTPVDQHGRYDEPLEPEFPFIIKFFPLRHREISSDLTWHDRLELFIPLDRPASMRMGDRTLEVNAGEILIVENLKLHRIIDDPNLDSRLIVISFLPSFVYSLGSPCHDYFFLLPFYTGSNHKRVVREPSALLGMHPLIGVLLRCYTDPNCCYFEAACKASLLQLLYQLADHLQVNESLRSEMIRQQERAARLKPVLEFLSKNYTDPISLKEAASLARMSLPRFIRLFKKVSGMTFVNYVTHLRISNGLRLLKESSLTVTEIAAEVGFADQSYFSRRFKAAFGQTPGQVRANREKRQVLPRKRLDPSTGLAGHKISLAES